MNIVIIGGGIAGTTAAGELRLLDKKANITIIDSEEHPVYSRVLLLPYVLKDVHREKLFLKKMSWYDAQSIELMSTTSVIGIDSVNKHVATSDGRELPYDKLLITTGLDVRLLAQDKRGVCYFKTLADADNLLTLIHERIAEKNKKAVGLDLTPGQLSAAGEVLTVVDGIVSETSRIINSYFNKTGRNVSGVVLAGGSAQMRGILEFG